MNASGMSGLIESLRNTRENGGIVNVSGMTGGASALAAARLAEENGGQILLIVSTSEKAKQIEEFLAFFAENRRVYVLPDEERSRFQYEAKSRVLSYERLKCLSAALSGEECIFVAPVMAAVKGMPDVSRFREVCIDISLRDAVNYDEIREMLIFTGYERTEVTEVRGQFSIRGSIIDIFPPDAEYPFRIDLFGDEVDDLKLFDPLTQRSVRSLDSVHILPATVPNPASEKVAAFFWDYMSEEKRSSPMIGIGSVNSGIWPPGSGPPERR